MQTNCGIYQIVHKESGKKYIGSSVNLHKRKKDYYPKHSDICAMGGYGFSSLSTKYFYYGIIEYFPDDFPLIELRIIEHEWIKLVQNEFCLNVQKNYRVKQNKKAKKRKPKIKRLPFHSIKRGKSNG